jgi:hypothetical protein
MPLSRLLGKLTLTLEVPQQDGTTRRRGFSVELNPAPTERHAGDSGEQVLSLPLETLESLLGVPIHVEERRAARLLVVYAMPRASSTHFIEEERPLKVGQHVRAIKPEHGSPVRKPGTLGVVVEMPPNCPGYDGYVRWVDSSDSCPVEAGQYEVVPDLPDAGLTVTREPAPLYTMGKADAPEAPDADVERLAGGEPSGSGGC